MHERKISALKRAFKKQPAPNSNGHVRNLVMLRQVRFCSQKVVESLNMSAMPRTDIVIALAIALILFTPSKRVRSERRTSNLEFQQKKVSNTMCLATAIKVVRFMQCSLVCAPHQTDAKLHRSH